MQTDLLFSNSTHETFHTLLSHRSIARNQGELDKLPMEVKYVLIRLSSLGVLVFTADKIEVAEGMEGWMQIYWQEASRTW